jgi:KUP system potassium uptake protein
MIFWTWAKGLEDAFDGSNRRNLRQFISTEIQDSEKKNPTCAASPSIRSGDDAARDEAGVSEMNVVTLEDQLKEEVSLFLHRDTPTSLTRRTSAGLAVDEKKGEKEEKLVLVRLPTCAIFHKSSAGKGAPHTFYGFLRQWPSVPRIVVSIILFIRQYIAYP